ncbi:2-keto-3-deoxy-phosphogluconate aldolase [Azomonas agilis]|uniref:2-dehydro-3-deoxy-phosphogluconate aldolase n=1 Tax=Azomonas agilis TaxID=116849 RepID=A0A562J173_9GAMM|nr:bifunctional 4-hydroxy-2-oxoglutarate aldolase/2-dehydro-3-deoxy-phosphogluconate aldolase [Azomonas agilis]TWH76873.1 2-keto-3-deoxy-phosphogluconate aldolase [Azomonas agilis]
MNSQAHPQPCMAEKTALIDQWCRNAKILPVITIERAEDILPMADAIAAGGLNTLEITLRSEWGLEAIRLLRAERPQMCIGAGTVLDNQMLHEAIQVGAQFIVTPGSTPELLQAGRNYSVPLLPGVSSASGIMLGYALGYRRFKLFPAEIAGGIPALKAFSGPFNNIAFCPTGGVNPDNVRQYMAQPNVMCVGGTWMLERAWVQARDWSRIQTSCREALDALN